jgi:predicted phosphodiesterase
VKLGVFSDLHADLQMLEAALERMQALGCEAIVCAGDIVDGEVFPDECIARLAADTIRSIRGNHDRWALEHAGALRRQRPGRRDLRADGPSSTYEPEASAALGSGFPLAAASLRWLAELPISIRLDLDGVRVAIHHARPGNWGGDMVGIDPGTTAPAQLETLLDIADAEILLVGHTHERFAVRLPSGRLVANPGALWSGGVEHQRRAPLYMRGVPSHGTFGVLDVGTRRFCVYRASDGALVLDSEADPGPASKRGDVR